jgi:hypothetical protein
MVTAQKTIDNTFQAFIAQIKKGTNYKTEKKKFEEWVSKKDRTNDNLKYFLVFDIDLRKFKQRSEYNVTQNNIVLMEATLPPKRNNDKPIEYTEYKYTEAEKE